MWISFTSVRAANDDAIAACRQGSNFNAVICKMINFMCYWWIIQKFCYFISKRGLKFAYLEGIFNTWNNKTRHSVEFISETICDRGNPSIYNVLLGAINSKEKLHQNEMKIKNSILSKYEKFRNFCGHIKNLIKKKIKKKKIWSSEDAW
jgi:hypothetical protein